MSISENKLREAISNEEFDEVKNILNTTLVDINYKDSDGWSFLMLASALGHLNVVELLLDNDANINEKNDSGRSSLMISSMQGHLDVVELLLSRGANINDKDEYGNTALMLASRDEQIDVVKLLLSKGANFKDKDDNGETALDKTTNTEIRQILERWPATMPMIALQDKLPLVDPYSFIELNEYLGGKKRKTIKKKSKKRKSIKKKSKKSKKRKS